MTLTLEQQACNFETTKHIHLVQQFLHIFAREMMRRGEIHDRSKLESPEVELFTELTPKLAACSYGSPEYKEFLKELKPALDHHYAKNPHHPEHWKNGIRDMSLFDIIEMFCDWKAASQRHHDGNILKSIEINATRFGMSQELVSIFENTAKAMESMA
jgi:hypothetical protein